MGVPKWGDVRNVGILTTKYAPIMISSTNSTYHGCLPKQKPLVVIVCSIVDKRPKISAES